MRVIGGCAKGRTLYTPGSNRIRPTADRVKEALFSILYSRFSSFSNLKVLDIFAGTGSLGIEALSRGAHSSTFIDSHPESIRLVRRNLELTGFSELSTLLQMDAVKGVEHLSAQGEYFDIILIDPPYIEKALTERVISSLAVTDIMNPDAVIAVETDKHTDLSVPESMTVSSKRVYGDTVIWLIEKVL